MRSHAKAATAGSTQHRTTDLHSFLCGAVIATLAALLALSMGTGSALAAAPAVSSTSVSVVTTSSALLEADINPEGEATTYHFEYGLASCVSNPCASIPVPDGNVGSASSPVRVKREAEGLTADATYHYRVIAINGSGAVEGPDRTFKTYAPPTVDVDCPNQTNRVGSAANLADCRAYEMVTPLEKNGADIKTLCNINCNRTALNQASLDGNKLAYSSFKSFGNALSNLYSNQYIATRGASGWSTDSINPPHGRTPFSPEFSTYWDLDIQFKAMSADLSTAWITDDSMPPLTPEAVNGEVNLFERDNRTDAYDAIAPQHPIEFGAGRVEVDGNTPSGDHILFTTSRKLTSDAPENEKAKLYDFTDGESELVSLLPSGEANPEYSWLGGNGHEPRVDNAVSADGSHIFWSSTETGFSNPGQIYVRIDGQTTVAVSESVAPDNAQFWTASVDGGTAVFSIDKSLYRFDVAAETPVPVAEDVYGVLGASNDASHLYFVSGEELAPGATTGEPNLYLDLNGATSFIATVAPSDVGEEWGSSPRAYDNVALSSRVQSSRVSADGTAVAFQSIESLTGYDNLALGSGEPAVEVYVYDAEADRLSCASCNPSGARPHAEPLQLPFKAVDSPASRVGNPVWGAAWLTTSERRMYDPRALSDDGDRLFFNAFDALAPHDNNGQQDVYQWEALGKGTCEDAKGCISLISSGQSPKPSEFVDASPDGRDVFFSTNGSLDPRDPGLIDIYNAREGGGYPPPPAPPTPCVGDSCQSIPPAPDEQTPASASFRGAGDPNATRARNCGAQGRQARKLSRRAKRLTKRARKVASRGQARRLQRRSARFSKRAKRLSKRATRCRRANRRAQR